MSVDDLLKPRYKVIADYLFNNHFTLGEVFLVEEESGYAAIGIDKYPHLFKKLQWWQDRKPEEMPEYVKHFKFPTELMVKIDGNFQGIFHNDQGLWPYVSCDSRFIHNANHHPEEYYYRDFIPATEQEYNDYKSKQP